MSIDQRRYVDIASGVVGATAAAMQKLDMRIMTGNTLVPTDGVLEFTGALGVADYFGASSEEAGIAAAYFAYVSPAPVSRARAIQFASHVTTNRAPGLTGTTPGTIGDITDITNPELTLDWSIGGVAESETITPDLSTAVSYADVATALTDASSEASFTYEQVGGQGVFVATLSGSNYETAAFSGNASSALGLTNAQFDAGSSVQSMLESYTATTQLNDSFGSVWFMEQGDLDDVVDTAELNASFNVKHQLYIDVPPSEAEDYAAALLGTASVGLLLRRPQDEVTLAVLPGAIMSATDYTRVNATTNYMFRQYGVTFPAQVTSDTQANLYDPLRVNYYGRTAVAGSSIEFFQRGFLCGGLTAPVDMSVHANEQWLKAYIAQQWFTLLLSTRGIPANSDGAARMRVIIAEAVTRALNNGTILPGRNLTPGQIIAIGDATGDELAHHDVRDKGYWYDVFIEEETGPSGLPEYVGKYTLVYGKGDWIRKVEGSHNLV